MLSLLGDTHGAASYHLAGACVLFALMALVVVLFLCLLAALGRKAIRWLLPAVIGLLMAIVFLGVFFEVVMFFACPPPIYAAIEEGDLQTVKRLVKEDPNLLDADGLARPTPLAAASEKGHMHIVRFLISEGADVEKGLSPPLAKAAEKGHVEIGRILLENGADIERRHGRSIWTALHTASFWGNARFVRMLLEHGADIDARDGAHVTPLILAAKEGHAEVVRVLLEHGADPNETANGYTALFRATEHDHTGVARFLLEYGADPDTAAPHSSLWPSRNDELYRMLKEARAKKKQAAGRREHPAS